MSKKIITFAAKNFAYTYMRCARQIKKRSMRYKYTHPCMTVAEIAPQQVLCGSGSGWAEIGDYDKNTTGGFAQPTF